MDLDTDNPDETDPRITTSPETPGPPIYNTNFDDHVASSVRPGGN
jgi:hypothetical protein